MTPQESELVDELFDRLVQLETTPRDAEAERLIANGLRRAPHAAYALVQTVLLQDEALKRANARIEELQAQTSPEPEQRPASFLDSMREALGGRAPRGSVPSVRTAGGNQSQGQQLQQGYPQQMPLSGYPSASGFGSGGSFLGTAASTAAGVLGGSLLLDGIRSMFGHELGGATTSAFARGRDQSATDADREQDRQQDLADDDREQDRQQDLADDDREQDAEQDLADDDAEQDSEQDLTDDFSDDSDDA